MLFSLFQSPSTVLLMIPVILIALTVHEYAHALAADRMGDPTPRSFGRLTLNPLKHLNPIGTLCMLLLGFGWANPVPVNARNFKKPRRGMLTVALAGPLSNLLLSLLGIFFYLLLLRMSAFLYAGARIGHAVYRFLLFFASFFYIFHILNLSFCIFNLLPIPPLDGSRVLAILLSPRAAVWYMRNERKIYTVLLVWLLLGTFVYRVLIRVPFITSHAWTMVLLKLFTLTGWLSDAVMWLSSLLFKLFSFIPFLS